MFGRPRDEPAAKHFLTKTIHRYGVPEKITIEHATQVFNDPYHIEIDWNPEAVKQALLKRA